MNKNTLIFLLSAGALIAFAACGKKVPATTTTMPPVSRADAVLTASGLVNIRRWDPDILVELRYSTTNNFLRADVYGELTNCFLQPEVTAMLTNAEALLEAKHPDYRLLVYDGARPSSIQRVMFERVRGTQFEMYVANPDKVSLHNYGCAVDLTIAGKDGVPLDMGSGYDSFEDISQPRYEEDFVTVGLLTMAQVMNREMLREVMKQAGFSPIRSEWWHFDAMSREQAAAKYSVIP